MLALKINQHASGHEIAALFGTTRGAVYQRLFRLRAGRYNASARQRSARRY